MVLDSMCVSLLAMLLHIGDSSSCEPVLISADDLPSIGAFASAVDIAPYRAAIGTSVPFPGLDPARACIVEVVDDQTIMLPLVPAKPTRGASFGTSISLDADRVAVGAPMLTSVDSGGAVVLFERTTEGLSAWTETGIITSAHPMFGAAISLDGDRLAVSVPGTDVSIHHRIDGRWQPEATIVPTEGDDAFARSIALSAQVLVCTTAVGVQVYERTATNTDVQATWHEIASWSLANVSDVDTDGATIVIGTDAGIWMSERTGTAWRTPAMLAIDGLEQTVVPAGRVSVSGDRIASSTMNGDRIVVWRRAFDGAWRVDREIVVPAFGALSQLGATIALHDGWLIAGAPGADIAGPETGAAAILDLGACDACIGDCAPRRADGAAGNGRVNIDDVVEVVLAIGSDDPVCDIAPEGGDGMIDVDDIVAVLANVGCGEG
ncbi:MAG: hypothetical protein AAF432_02230 [Planctomycetota bacterium]